MSRKQLISLMICYVAPFAVGNAVLSLLPIYVRQLGADSTQTGFYLAIAFGALSVGSLGSGWLSSRLQRRKSLLLLAAGLNLPVTFLMGQVDTLPLLTLITALAWLLAGVQIAMANILVGLYADEHHRGRIFGVLAAGHSVAQLLAGLGSGWIVDHWGYSALFTVSASTYIVSFVAALLAEDKPATLTRSAARSTSQVSMSTAFLILLSASILVHVANFITGLGRPLAMDALDFDATAIASTIAISGAVNIPLPIVIGWLSDRIGRRPLLVWCNLAVAVGVGLLTFSTTIWQFWLAMIFITLIRSGIAIGSALITDLVEPQHLSASLSRFSATPFIGGVIGYAFGGMAIQAFGLTMTLLIATMLALVATTLVVAGQPKQRVALARP